MSLTALPEPAAGIILSFLSSQDLNSLGRVSRGVRYSLLKALNHKERTELNHLIERVAAQRPDLTESLSSIVPKKPFQNNFSFTDFRCELVDQRNKVAEVIKKAELAFSETYRSFWDETFYLAHALNVASSYSKSNKIIYAVKLVERGHYKLTKDVFDEINDLEKELRFWVRDFFRLPSFNLRAFLTCLPESMREKIELRYVTTCTCNHWVEKLADYIKEFKPEGKSFEPIESYFYQILSGRWGEPVSKQRILKLIEAMHDLERKVLLMDALIRYTRTDATS